MLGEILNTRGYGGESERGKKRTERSHNKIYDKSKRTPQELRRRPRLDRNDLLPEI
jgi:hypothetical protein